MDLKTLIIGERKEEKKKKMMMMNEYWLRSIFIYYASTNKEKQWKSFFLYKTLCNGGEVYKGTKHFGEILPNASKTHLSFFSLSTLSLSLSKKTKRWEK